MWTVVTPAILVVSLLILPLAPNAIIYHRYRHRSEEISENTIYGRLSQMRSVYFYTQYNIPLSLDMFKSRDSIVLDVLNSFT